MQRYSQYLIITIILVILAVLIIWPSNPGIHFAGINKDFKTQLGLDLVGGVQALLEADLPEGETIDSGDLDTAVRIVENRVNGLGTTEAVVQKAGDRRIVVELPGETDPDKALATIKQTALLEFVDMSNISPQEISALELNGKLISTTNNITSTEGISQTGTIFTTVMTGKALTDAQISTDQTGGYEVNFVLNDEGKEIFKEFTSQHVGDVLAIVLDKKIISSPVIQNVIPDGQGRITGKFTYDEATNLAVQLRYGALPVPLKIVESRTIGATLGKDSLNKSLIAGAIGFTVVFLFMGIYYRVPGIIADIAMIIYAMVAFAIFRTIPITLTLAGIAGFLLSTGSALDANILIFERMKEELRNGRSISQSMEQGWKRAWTSIRDSNIATLITCGILFWFGSQFGASIVKGFAVTLGIGVLISLLVAIVVTRSLLWVIFRNYTPDNKNRWFGL